nr:polysaccharide biosynthesis/export protein [uncultured bacterium]
MTEDIRKLLGGYATGTLTEQERQLLFDAALHDDQLFAALADEHALKELLDDSAVRAQLLQATEDPRFSIRGGLSEWFAQPKAKALVAVAAVLLIAIAFKAAQPGSEEMRESKTQIAQLRNSRAQTPQPSASEPPQSPTPAPAKAAKRVAPPSAAQSKTADERAQSLTIANSPPAGVVGGVIGGVIGGVPAAAPLPPVPAPQIASAQRIRYELLRRDENGQYQPVSADYEFSPGDFIRLRVWTEQAGALAISVPGQATVGAPVNANTWTVIPATSALSVTPEIANLVLGFVVPTDVTDARGAATARFAESAKRVGPGASVTLEIPIRQRKP